MNLLTGEYNNTIDDKGRVSFPVKLRTAVNQNVVMVTKGLDTCLWLFTMDEWEAFQSKLMSNASMMKGSNLAVSANTVGEYMEALCDTYMIDRVKRYDIKGKSVFEQQDKYYFEDLGLRNYLCRDKRNLDMEKVLEGAVYMKLKRSGYDVYVGQLNGKEIDFVARRGDELNYVQVALQVSSEDTYEREFGNLKLIKDNYPKYVVTMDPNVGLIHDSGIVACSARQFLLNLEH